MMTLTKLIAGLGCAAFVLPMVAENFEVLTRVSELLRGVGF